MKICFPAQARCRGERGSVIVEFLCVFPAFILLSMFGIEVGLMWADRHVARLAAFEAARVYASATLPEWQANGTVETKLCDAPLLKKRARLAALEKIAIVSPPIDLFMAGLGVDIHALALDTSPLGQAGGAFLRLAKRWPTAVASTSLKCDYDEAIGNVRVTLRYDRMMATPIAGRVMFWTYRLSQLNAHSPIELGLDENFMGMNASLKTPQAIQELKDDVLRTLASAKTLDLSLEQVTTMLAGIPALGPVSAAIPSFSATIAEQLGAMNAEVAAKMDTVALANAIQNTIDQQAQVLTTIVGVLPESLQRIPLTVDATVQRQSFSQSAVALGATFTEKKWDGRIRGVFKFDGAYRTWGKELSVGHADLTDGATPIEQL